MTEEYETKITQDIIIREENGILVLEVRMPENLRKRMSKLAEETSGAIIIEKENN